MRKLILSAAILSAVAVAAPAAAAAQHRGYQNAGIEQQLDQIENRIDRLRDRRQISRGEANRLERQAEQIDRLHDRYRRGGLNRAEVRDLQGRIQNLRGQIRWDRADRR